MRRHAHLLIALAVIVLVAGCERETRTFKTPPAGGVALNAVQSMEPGLRRVTQALASRFTYSPQWDITKHAALTPLRDAMIGSMRPVLYATAAGMLVILLIACANVGALMLGQMERRSTELSLRAALGADRSRIVGQVVLESFAIGSLAAVVAGWPAYPRASPSPPMHSSPGTPVGTS